MALAAPAVDDPHRLADVTRGLLLAIASWWACPPRWPAGFRQPGAAPRPDAVRGRAFARYETRFQLAWVLGGVVATAITFPAELSMVSSRPLYIPAIFLFVRASGEARRFEGESPDGAHDLAAARLAAADAWQSRGPPPPGRHRRRGGRRPGARQRRRGDGGGRRATSPPGGAAAGGARRRGGGESSRGAGGDRSRPLGGAAYSSGASSVTFHRSPLPARPSTKALVWSSVR